MRKSIILILVMVVLLLFSCQGYRRNPETTRFFVGTEGVVTNFEYIPTKIYYYGDTGPEGNTFEIGVRAWNKGSSFTRGAVFLSGFDPDLIRFREINIGPTSGCGISIVSIGFGQFGGIFSCGDSYIMGGGGETYVNLENIGEILSGFGVSWWDSSKFDFDVSYSDYHGQKMFNVDFDFPNVDLEYYGHGRLFLAIFSGINFEALNGQEFFLAGNLPEFPGGEVAYFTYSGTITNWPMGLDEAKQTIMLTTCYLYTTYAAPLVCIDPDPQSDVRKICIPRSTGFKSQGAPVAITSVEQENTPKKIIFRINIANVGRGQVFDPGNIAKCSPYFPGRVKESDLNMVWVGDARIGRVRLQDCTPAGFVRLQNGRGTITCTYPVQYAQLKSAYETPLVLELWYGYSETQQRNIYMKRVT